MVVLKRKKYFLKMAEVHLTGDYELYNPDKGRDIVVFYHSTRKYKGSGEFHTLLIDLSKDTGKLYTELDRNTRNNINRAVDKDGLSIEITGSLSDEDLERFRAFYDTFARQKGLPVCDMVKLQAFKEMNALVLSVVKDKDGNTLCCHMYVKDGQNARLLYSASHFRNSNDRSYRSLIGRANRYLHWMDIKFFKEQGYLFYDFGGLALKDGNEELSNIDRFKKGFGGTVTTLYYFYKGISLLGKLVLLVSRKKAA
jgi:lipid II:glycine glycyltransferase (peptidoglycan interpeptide bridge formation enzyme)